MLTRNPKPSVLILNGSLSEITIIQAAQKLGFYVVTTGNDPSLIGHQFADEYVPADYSNGNAVLDIVKSKGIDRVISCANDFGVLTACYVAEKLGMPGHDTFKNALLIHQKDLFKNYLAKMEIRSPLSKAFSDEEEAKQFALTMEYPIIAKAVDLTGGKGILKAEDYSAAPAAISYAFAASRRHSIVLEPFIEGAQQSLVAFVVDGKVISSVSNDTYMPINPYLIQSETLPAKGIELVQDELHSTIETICRDLGLEDGLFTLQYIVRDGKPYIIEAMRRCLGNQFLTVAHASNGFPWEEALVRAETGMGGYSQMKIENPIAPYVGHHGVMATENGVIDDIRIDEELEKHLFHRVDIMGPGDTFTNYMQQRASYLYYSFETREEIDSVASRLNELSAVVIQKEENE